MDANRKNGHQIMYLSAFAALFTLVAAGCAVSHRPTKPEAQAAIDAAIAAGAEKYAAYDLEAARYHLGKETAEHDRLAREKAEVAKLKAEAVQRYPQVEATGKRAETTAMEAISTAARAKAVAEEAQAGSIQAKATAAQAQTTAAQAKAAAEEAQATARRAEGFAQEAEVTATEAMRMVKQATETYTVRKGDSLSSIAARVFGDPARWRLIYEANRDRIKTPDLIFPGQALRIPRQAPIEDFEPAR